jgi:D-alanyl-D-alanine carboxypeptidase/D-alanyl-D-alanine-endopeptidase (penicillin-binding protein 4)
MITMTNTRRFAALLAVLASTACGARSPAAPAQPQPDPFDFARVADSIIRTPPLHRAHLGIMVYDPATKRVLYDHNGARRFVPASNQKLWPTSTALHVLGPDYRYRTPVLAVGVTDGAAGTLIVVGSGDPTWSARFHDDDHAVLDMLADSVVAAGIRRITGDLVIDASGFDAAVIPGAWTFGNLNGTSAPPTGAFVVAEGIFRVRTRPGAAAGEPALVEPIAPEGVVPVSNRTLTSATGNQASINTSRGPWSDTLHVTGSIPLTVDSSSTRLPMTEPVRFAAHRFADALRVRGVTIDGAVHIVRDTAEASALRAGANVRTVATWVSPPMRDIVAAILGPSQNWIAEQLVRTLGREKAGIGSWNAGLRVERQFLADVVGIDTAALRMNDGSGMSPQNLVAPEAVVKLLEYARTAPWGADFRAALAGPGRPGTLNRRLTELTGRLEGKTGTLNSVNALSGYVRTRDGRELIFSFMSNASGLGGDPVVAALDKLAMALAEGSVPR